jgi:hypothetical protein
MMARFLDRTRELHRPGLLAPWKEHFDRVFEILIELQRVHSKAELDLNNIEAVFTTFELGQTIRKLPGANDDFEGAVNSLKAIIAYTVEQSMRFPLDENKYIRAPYDYAEFAKFVKDFSRKNMEVGRGRIAVLTFNYDVGLEVGLSHQGINFDYCLDDSGGDAIKLLKLHGSVNWGRRIDGGAIIPMPMQKWFAVVQPAEFLEPDRKFLTVSVGAQIAPFMRRELQVEVDETPVIVPPGLFKNEYQGSISRVWQQAAKELEEAEEIIVIGYSLPETDFFFRNLFALGTVGRKFIRRFAVVNPDESGTTEQRFRSLLGPGTKDRFDYLPCKFADVITEMRNWYNAQPPRVIRIRDL